MVCKIIQGILVLSLLVLQSVAQAQSAAPGLLWKKIAASDELTTGWKKEVRKVRDQNGEVYDAILLRKTLDKNDGYSDIRTMEMYIRDNLRTDAYKGSEFVIYPNIELNGTIEKKRELYSKMIESAFAKTKVQYRSSSFSYTYYPYFRGETHFKKFIEEMNYIAGKYEGLGN